MGKWATFPYKGEFSYTPATVKKMWSRLHAGDCEPLPRSASELSAWVHYHNGEFEQAVKVGMQAGGSGVNAANKAACVYATHLEPKEENRLALYMQVAERAQALQEDDPSTANAWYLQAYALGRYSQGISVAKALAEGLGTRVRKALENTIRLAPKHADAHLALAAFHAEVIDKVGPLIGGLTYGASKTAGLKLYASALALNPEAPITLIEYANGLVMLEGERRMPEATDLYHRAVNLPPADAMDRLDIEMARTELEA